MGIVREPSIWSFITSPPSLKIPTGSGGYRVLFSLTSTVVATVADAHPTSTRHSFATEELPLEWEALTTSRQLLTVVCSAGTASNVQGLHARVGHQQAGEAAILPGNPGTRFYHFDFMIKMC